MYVTGNNVNLCYEENMQISALPCAAGQYLYPDFKKVILSFPFVVETSGLYPISGLIQAFKLLTHVLNCVVRNQ